MTEAEWLACDDSRQMLAFLGKRLTDRKRRLFTHACGRCWCHIWPEEKYETPKEAEYWLPKKPVVDQLRMQLFDAADDQCDGADRKQEVEVLRNQLFELGPLVLTSAFTASVRGDVDYWVNERFATVPSDPGEQASMDAGELWETAEKVGSVDVSPYSSSAARPRNKDLRRVGGVFQQSLWEASDASQYQAGLFRELVGNPFQAAVAAPACRTHAVASLALAAYVDRDLGSGHLDNARLAVLSDALEEAGCTDEAILAHLRSSGPHIGGCWALDLVLGKE